MIKVSEIKMAVESLVGDPIPLPSKQWTIGNDFIIVPNDGSSRLHS